MFEIKILLLLCIVHWSISMTVFRRPSTSHAMIGNRNSRTKIGRFDVDCNQFRNDYDIIYQLPFPIVINPSNDAQDKTAAFISQNQNHVTRLIIINEHIVPSTIFCLQNLQALRIVSTPFLHDIVPDDLANLQQLQQLSISHTPIAVMTQQLSSLTNLSALYLQNCSLTHLPDLTSLHQLQYLQLEHNLLSTVHGLTNVLHLDLNNNLFSDMPSLVTPHTLEYLNMNDNPLENIHSILSHTNLYALQLKNTTLSMIPSTIDQLQQIQNLDLSCNRLVDLPTNMFSLSTLKYLDIESNLFPNGYIEEMKTRFNEVFPSLTLLV